MHVRGRRTFTRTRATLALTCALLAPAAHAASLNQTGRWVASPSLGFSSTHTVVLREPGTDATKVFMFGESGSNQTMRFWRFFPGDTNLITPTTGGVRSQLLVLPHPNNLATDLFCTGHATLPDGRMIMVGGAWIPLSPCREVYTLDPAWRPGVTSPAFPWTASAQMAVQRWYATATPLPDGGILASAGTMSSGMIAFGGLARVRGADTTWRVLQPLNLATRYSWGDTTAAPGDTCAHCGTARDRALRWTDSYTAGRYPPGREGHVFVGDYSGRCFVFGGRRRLSNGAYEVLGDAWHLYNSLADDDSTHAWSELEQVGDPALPAGQNLPGPRWGCAATWAGVEERDDTKLPETSGVLICYLHGGRDAAGNVLGDLWRGERRLVAGPHYQWAWKRILAGGPTTMRYGHTMMFDPGAPGTSGAPRAKLVIFGGWVSPTQIADPRQLLVVGVGPQSVSPGTWRVLSPPGLVPPPRAWHAMTPRWRDMNEDTDREYYMFGGENGLNDAAARPVAPDVWVLERPDQSATTEDAFHWERLVAAGQGPSGRSRPAMGFSVDGDMLVIAGGDTTGSAVPGGQTDALWTLIGRYYNNTITWHQPLVRSFHPAPPPIAGMGLVALGAGRARVTRSLERFNPLQNSNAGADCGPLFGQWRTITTPDPASEQPIADYPNIFVLPDGRLFNAGPAISTDPQSPRGHYKRFFDLRTARWGDGIPGDQRDPIQFGSAVMVRPGRLLRAGSTGSFGTGATQLVDIGAGQTPPWVPYAASGTTRPALLTRTHGNLTLLPTGDVLASGGVRTDADVVGSAVKTPQIWSVARGRWSNPTAGSTEALAPDPWIRNYHSTAVLLPDARVLTAGGEAPSPDSEQTSASVFEPPYLFRANGTYATRPGIASAPAFVAYGGDFTLRLADPSRTATIRGIALMRPSASTHGFDQGQRYVPLDFVAASAPARLLVRAPADANLAPPGDYLLFVVDSLATDAPAVPSVARWVRVGPASSAPVDSADGAAPRGGEYLALRDESTCDDAQVGASVRVAWTAPADDDTLAFSGRASGYELRYAPNADAASPFATWTRLFTPAPGPVGSTEGRLVPGLKSSEWYVFALRAAGDGGDTSAFSAPLLTKPLECVGGAGAGDAGGAANGVPAQGGLGSPGDVVAGENNLFPGIPPGLEWLEVMPLANPPRLENGTRRLYVREGFARGVAMDRLTLASVDHAPGADAVPIPGGTIYVGQRRAAVRVVDALGRDLTSQALGIGLGPVHADSGATLFVTLAPVLDGFEDVLVVESAWGSSERTGISVDGQTGTGTWRPVGSIHPRRGWSEQGLLLRGATQLRLRFHDAVAIRFIGRLGAAVMANTSGAAPVFARTADGTDWTQAVMTSDGRDGVVVPGDTLQLAFTNLPAPAGSERSWFLVVDGAPLTPADAYERAQRGRLDAPGPAPVAFALHQNVPNPFAHATEFRFDLPRAADVELAIYDLQGRIVRRFASHEDAGRRSYRWDLRDADGHPVAPGVYAYRMRAGTFTAERKLVVMR